MGAWGEQDSPLGARGSRRRPFRETPPCIRDPWTIVSGSTRQSFTRAPVWYEREPGSRPQNHYPSEDQKRCKTGATTSGASAIQQ
jgi:hypothetical protein